MNSKSLNNSVVDPFEGIGEPVNPDELRKVRPVESTDPFEGVGTPVSPEELKSISSGGSAIDPFGGIGEPVDLYEAGRKEVESQPWYGYIGKQKPITPDEIDAIAKKHGVPSQLLQENAQFLGADTGDLSAKGVGETLKGFAGEAIALGLPQKQFISSQEDPKVRAALDDLRQLAEARKGIYRRGAELVAPGGVVKAGTSLPLRLGLAAAQGAAAGLGQSRSGEEIPGTLAGAAIGTSLVGGAVGLSKTFGKVGRIVSNAFTQDTREDITKAISKDALYIDDEARKLLTTTKPVDDAVTKVISTQQRLPPEESLKAAEIIPNNVIARYMNPETEDGGVLAEAVYGNIETARNLLKTNPEQYTAGIAEHLGQSKVDDNIYKFVSDMGIDADPSEISATDAMKLLIRQEGVEGVQRAYQEWTMQQARNKYITSKMLKYEDSAWDPVRSLARKLSTFSMVSRTISDKVGMDAYKAQREVTERINILAHIKEEDDRLFAPIWKMTKKAGLTPEQITAGLEVTDADFNKLTIPQQKVIEEWRKYFTTGNDSLLRRLQRGIPDPEMPEYSIPGLPIRELDKYATHMVVDPPTFVLKMEQLQANLEKKAGKAIGAMTPEELATVLATKETDPGVRTFIDVVKWAVPDVDISSPRNLERAVDEATTLGSATDLLHTRAGASLERTGNIPDFIREKNILKIRERYLAGNFRHMLLREPLQKLRDISSTLKNYGDTLSATMVEDFIKDQTGLRKGTFGALTAELSNEMRLKYLRKASETTNSVQKLGYKTLAESPELVSAVFNNLYHNFLGYKVRGVIRNLTQVPTMVGPQLGSTPYSYSRVAMGMGRTLTQWKALSAEAKAFGFSNPHVITSEARDALREGIMRSALFQIPARVLRKLGDIGMVLLEASDQYNRLSTMGVAKQVISDLMTDKTGYAYREALATLGRQDRVISGPVLNAIARNKPREAYRILAAHLVGSTQFMYNKGEMSQFGRSLGPMLSTFSTWPSAMLGNLTHQVEVRGFKKGSMEFAKQMFGPLMLAAAMQQLLFGKPSEMSEREKALIGSGGLVDWAGVTSITGVSQFGRPPIVDLLIPYLQAPGYLLSGETELAGAKAKQALKKTQQAFVPGSSLVSFLTSDLPLFFTGERPDDK